MSVDQVSGIAGGITGTGLGGITGTLQGGLNNLLNAGSGFLDKWFPPDKREALKSKLTKFATEKPLLASFLLSQIAISGPVIALFIIMTISVIIFALLAGILVGVLGALLFIVGAVLFALLILLPLLFFTTTTAVFIWLWGLAAYYIMKWFNKKDVPGVTSDPAGTVNGLLDKTGLSSLPGVSNVLDQVPKPAAEANGSAAQADTNGHPKSNPEHVKTEHPDTNGSAHHHNTPNHNGPKKLEKRPHSTARKEKESDGGLPQVPVAGGVVNGVGDGVGGAVGGATKKLGL